MSGRHWILYFVHWKGEMMMRGRGLPESSFQGVIVRPSAAPDPSLSSDPGSRMCVWLPKEMAVGTFSINHICSSGNMGQTLTHFLSLWVRKLQWTQLNGLLMVIPVARPGLLPTFSCKYCEAHYFLWIYMSCFPQLDCMKLVSKGNLTCFAPSPVLSPAYSRQSLSVCC